MRYAGYMVVNVTAAGVSVKGWSVYGGLKVGRWSGRWRDGCCGAYRVVCCVVY